MDLTTQATPIGRVALGTFLGYVIGFERELRGKAAGERTFGLLALGAAAVTGSACSSSRRRPRRSSPASSPALGPWARA